MTDFTTDSIDSLESAATPEPVNLMDGVKVAQTGGTAPAAADLIPASTATTATLTGGGYITGSIDTAGDHDWYRVTLTAGQTYTISMLNNLTLYDTVLALRDSAGTLIVSNDDVIPGGNYAWSEITYTATSSGTYYVDTGGYQSDTGTFYLTMSSPVNDVALGSTATTATLSVGGSATGAFEAAGDHDWYAIQLSAGQSYLLTTGPVGGVTVDTVLYVRDASGNPLAFNDDGLGGGGFSRIRFTAPSSGTYYIDVGVWGNQANSAGYTVSAGIAPPLPVYTNDQIATQLTTTYWSGATRHFNVAPGGTLTVNLTALTTDGQNLAREALKLWTDATGINFSEVATGGQIVFDDSQTGAFTSSTTSGGIITESDVNVGTDWLTSYGVTVRSYSFQTYIHEIGHALGLGHAGNYNTTATYPNDVSYLNDDWATSIMSYFDQVENTYFAGLGFTKQFAVTPMAADIIAVASLYGVNTLTRTGDTIYGVGNNTGRAIYDAVAGQTAVSFTIVDNGGNDTVDFSGYSSNARIDLNPEAFSNVGGRVGNMVIARGTIIENAITGSGADTIIGNAVNNRLQGNGGNDTLTGGAGQDTAVFGGLRSNYAIQANVDGTLRVTDLRTGSPDGADSLTKIERLQFSDVLQTIPTGADLNGDYVADLVFRSRSGGVAVWQQTGGTTPSALLTLGSPGTNFRLVGLGDFNSDGTSDLLFRGRDGTLATWQMALPAIVGGGTIGNPGAAWSVVGTGDYNGDGRGDVLFLNAVTGAYASWDLDGTAIIGGGTIGTPGSAWVYKASADFNGDGKTDILFQNANGSYAIWTLSDTAITGGGAIGNPGAGWFFKGTGDFNGDGKADILFQNIDGNYATWNLNGTAIVGGGTIGNPGSQWTLAGIGDYSGDARSDLLFRSTSGSYATWLLNNTAITGGGTIGNPGSLYTTSGGIVTASLASLVFQNSDGTVAGWTINGLAHVGGGTLGNPGGTWNAKAMGDFFASGETDVLFQDANGTLALWRSNGSQLLGGGGIGNPGANWVVRGTGDFNADGKSDIVFQNTASGAYASWDLNGTQIVGGGTIGTAAGFSFAGMGDMNGDGKTDMLFVDSGGTYASWLMDDIAIVGGGTIGNPGAGWTLKGLGDFNGDGKADLLFQNTDGSYATWDLDGTQIVGGGTIGNPGSQWSLAKIADLNADGRADLLFADAQGHYAAWLIGDTAILAGGNIDQISAGWTIV